MPLTEGDRMNVQQSGGVCMCVCVCLSQIANSGVDLIVSSSSSVSGGSQTVTASRSIVVGGGGGGGTEPVSFGVSDDRSKRLVDAATTTTTTTAEHKMEFDRQVAALSQWLDQTEGLLELVAGDSTPAAADSQSARLTVEEQLVLIEVRGQRQPAL